MQLGGNMNQYKYFVIVNTFYILFSVIIAILVSKQEAHRAITTAILVGEPITIYFMYKLKRIINKI